MPALKEEISQLISTHMDFYGQRKNVSGILMIRL